MKLQPNDALFDRQDDIADFLAALNMDSSVSSKVTRSPANISATNASDVPHEIEPRQSLTFQDDLNCQYSVSLYFMLTVFTTVGFGDIGECIQLVVMAYFIL